MPYTHYGLLRTQYGLLQTQLGTVQTKLVKCVNWPI